MYMLLRDSDSSGQSQTNHSYAKYNYYSIYSTENVNTPCWKQNSTCELCMVLKHFSRHMNRVADPIHITLNLILVSTII